MIADPQFSPSPQPVESNLVVPELSCSGLFGPRTPPLEDEDQIFRRTNVIDTKYGQAQPPLACTQSSPRGIRRTVKSRAVWTKATVPTDGRVASFSIR
jgi:hypothetical protein